MVAAGSTPTGMVSYIRDCWADTLEAEMASIREIVVAYPYVSMDTEFPGVVVRPIGTFKSSSDFHYQTLRCNVDILKIIQLGLTFSNDDGELAPGVCTYQFNFKFSLNDALGRSAMRVAVARCCWRQRCHATRGQPALSGWRLDDRRQHGVGHNFHAQSQHESVCSDNWCPAGGHQ